MVSLPRDRSPRPQSSTSDARPVHDSAVPLLTVKDPNRHSPHLMTASLELSQTGQLPAFPDDAVVTGRPATPDRGNGRVPLVRFLPEKELPLAMALSKRGRDNRRARAEADKLDDVMVRGGGSGGGRGALHSDGGCVA